MTTRCLHMQMQQATCLFVLILAVGCAGTESGIESSPIEVDFAVPNLDTPAQVQRALADAVESERAIVFVHMDWAIMAPQRDLYIRFMVEYHQRFPQDPVGFHYIDCTPITSDYTPLRSLPGWPGTGREIYARQGTGGGGDVIWIDHGVVQHVETVFDSEGVAELVAKTRTLFGAGQERPGVSSVRSSADERPN